MVYFQADLNRVVQWAVDNDQIWAFTPSNASAYYTESFNDLQDLDRIDWDAVNTHSFGGNKLIQERKAAEFLVYELFPWKLVEQIGVLSPSMQIEVRRLLSATGHQPPVRVQRSWYF